MKLLFVCIRYNYVSFFAHELAGFALNSFHVDDDTVMWWLDVK